MGTDPEFIPLRRRSDATLLNFNLLKWANFSTICFLIFIMFEKDAIRKHVWIVLHRFIYTFRFNPICGYVIHACFVHGEHLLL